MSGYNYNRNSWSR